MSQWQISHSPQAESPWYRVIQGVDGHCGRSGRQGWPSGLQGQETMLKRLMSGSHKALNVICALGQCLWSHGGVQGEEEVQETSGTSGSCAGAIGPEEHWGWGFENVRRKATARCGPEEAISDYLVCLESPSGW